MTFSSLRETPWIRKINSFLASPVFIIVAAILCLLSSSLSLELLVYTLYVLVVAFVCVMGRDLLPLMPIIMCCMLAPSAANNPGRNANSVLTGGYMVGLIVVLVLSILYFMLKNHCEHLKKLFKCKRRLLVGMLILWFAYMIGGYRSPAYPSLLKKNLFFSTLQAVGIIVPYFLFTALVDWKKVRKDYFGWLGLGIGIVLLGQLLWIYATKPVIQDGMINRRLIYAGWGMYNNIGSLLAMVIPFPFYLGIAYKKAWLGTIGGVLFMGGVLLSNSRTSMLGGAGIFAICVLVMIFTSPNKKRLLIALGVAVVAGIVGLMVFRNEITKLFTDIINRGADLNTRDEFYIEGINQFVKYPIFGGSFYPIDYVPWGWSQNPELSAIIPPRWHNTIIQLLACTGIVGLVTYMIHRFQTVLLFFSERSLENVHIALCIIVLLFTSLFDCHFFNVGPVLFYSMGLAFAEKHYKE